MKRARDRAPGSGAVSGRPGPPWAERGATLLELMVALAVLSVLLVALLLVWGQALVAYLQGSETADLQQEARVAHGRMTAELRLAGMNTCNQVPPGGEGAVTAADATSVTIAYFSPGKIDCSTGPAPTFQTTTYAYDAATRTFQRNAQALTGQLIESLGLQYLTCDGTSLAVPVSAVDRPNIARIAVTIVATETFSGRPLTRQLASTIHLRNTACPAGL